MNKKTGFILGLVGAFLGMGAALLFTSSPSQPVDPSLRTTSIKTPLPIEMSSTPNFPDKKRETADAVQSDLPLGAPSKLVLAEEVRNDLHATPASLLAFADRIATLMEPALQDVKAAKRAFEQLSECLGSENPDLSSTIKAICLANAARLSKKYPSEFANNFLNLVNESSPDLVSQAGISGNGPFGRKQ